MSEEEKIGTGEHQTICTSNSEKLDELLRVHLLPNRRVMTDSGNWTVEELIGASAAHRRRVNGGRQSNKAT